MRYRNGYPRYVSVAEKQAKAQRKLNQLRKKNPDLAPIIIDGRRLAESWWGNAWNGNLEGYADYSNRIGRGRSYVRNGAVLDLKIEAGRIISLVQGTASSPYRVTVDISPLDKNDWDAIVDQCRGAIDSLEALLDGILPKSMEKILKQRGTGLFPSPEEIRFTCSCPDWAYMCKHVAATLYGVGSRLDRDPSLFFHLRNVNMEDLVSSVARKEADELLKKAKNRRSTRIIQDADLSSAFGVDFEDGAPQTRPFRTGTTPDKPGEKDTAPSKRTEPRSPVPAGDAYGTVVSLIRRRRVNGIGFLDLKEKTGLDDTLLRNIIQRARQKKDIRNQARGLYIKG